jgi:hypothetical protein
MASFEVALTPDPAFTPCIVFPSNKNGLIDVEEVPRGKLLCLRCLWLNLHVSAGRYFGVTQSWISHKFLAGNLEE